MFSLCDYFFKLRMNCPPKRTYFYICGETPTVLGFSELLSDFHQVPGEASLRAYHHPWSSSKGPTLTTDGVSQPVPLLNGKAIQWSFGLHRELVLGHPMKPKFTDAQVLYVKWYNTCIEPTHILLYTFNCVWITHNTA